MASLLTLQSEMRQVFNDNNPGNLGGPIITVYRKRGGAYNALFQRLVVCFSYFVNPEAVYYVCVGPCFLIVFLYI